MKEILKPVFFKRARKESGFYSVILPSGKKIIIQDEETFFTDDLEDIKLLEKDTEIEKI